MKKLTVANLLGVIGLLFGLGNVLCQGADEAAFEAARAKLENGDAEGAREEFSAIIASNRFAPEVFFGLGNSHYRLGDRGASALAYRRALFLDPSYREAHQNLEFLSQQTAFVDTATPAVPSYATVVPGHIIAPGLVAAVIISALAAALLVALRTRPRWLTALCLVFIVFGGSSAAGLALLARGRDSARPPPESAVVIAGGVVARTAPAERASEIMPVPEGSILRVEAVRGKWVYVDLSDELRGWIRQDSQERLWPFDPALAGK